MHNDKVGSPFETIESAQEYLKLLCEGIAENRAALDADIEEATRSGATRRLDALRLIAYKLDRLLNHASQSNRLLKDLRNLRRLLLK